VQQTADRVSRLGLACSMHTAVLHYVGSLSVRGPGGSRSTRTSVSVFSGMGGGGQGGLAAKDGAGREGGGTTGSISKEMNPLRCRAKPRRHDEGWRWSGLGGESSSGESVWTHGRGCEHPGNPHRNASTAASRPVSPIVGGGFLSAGRPGSCRDVLLVLPDDARLLIASGRNGERLRQWPMEIPSKGARTNPNLV
jgi:hypothetical protein